MINPSIDLTECDKEPIHIPGSIQPHGILLVLQEADLNILQVSENLSTILQQPLNQILNQSLVSILGEEETESLKNQLQTEDLSLINPLYFTIQHKGEQHNFYATLLRYSGLLFIELEPSVRGGGISSSSFFYQTQTMLEKFQAANIVQELIDIAVHELFRLTQFDRVMGYRFDENWHGSVIAEAKKDEVFKESYLGLHFPSSDIPAQARNLYSYNWIRVITRADYEPIPLIPTNNPLTQEPLDLSISVLRSVSPVHLQYLQNMGVNASLSISILNGDELWGLLVCHSAKPQYIPYNVRVICEYIGQIVSLQIPIREQNQWEEFRFQVNETLGSLLKKITIATHCFGILQAYQTELLNLFSADGAYLCLENQRLSVGQLPPIEELQDLAIWCQSRNSRDIFATHHLLEHYPQAENIREVASGILYIPLFPEDYEYILLFRQEVIKTVNWAGDPNKPVDEELAPRRSFALWQEEVKGQAPHWHEEELVAARKLQKTLIDKLNSSKIHFRTYHDSLTQLPNRLLFEELLQRAINQGIVQKRQFILILIYIEQMSSVKPDNSRIKIIANFLKGYFTHKEEDSIARLSWSEFAVLQYDYQVDQSSFQQWLLQKLHAQDESLSLNIGIAHFPEDSTDSQKLIKTARQRLHAL